jgi:flagellar biosynthesis regulator FlaF
MKSKNNQITNEMPGKVDNYFIFEELPADSIGKNFRAVELKDETPVNHKLLTEVHPFLFKTPEEWTRVNVLCERIRHTGNPNLYASEKVIQKDDAAYLLFPFHRAKTLAQIVEDVPVKENPIPFELAFSIAIAIATIIEMGSSIVVKKEHAFQGFLTPDHIIIDYKGNIFLKYFGLWPLFDENEAAISEMARRYGAWLAPEFTRNEKIVPQSDFYYLGYTLYRMLTGNYFSYLPGEDFESTFTSISFVSDLPSTDIEFLTTLINFFKKTLNPSVNKRFANIREFKNYISKFFKTPLQDFSQFQASLAAYMQSLYADTMEEEEKMLAAELSEPLPRIQPITEEGITSEIMAAPIEGIVREEKKRSKLVQVILILIIVTLAGGTYFLIRQLNKAKEEQQIAAQMLEKQDKEKKEFEQQLQEVQQKLTNLEKEKPVNKEDQQIKDQTISRLKKQENELKQEVKARTKTITDPASKQSQKNPKIQKEDVPKDSGSLETGIKKTGDEKPKEVEPPQDSTKQPVPTIKKTETKKPAVTPGKEVTQPAAPLVSLKEVTLKPAKISGRDPQFPPAMKKTYAGRRATVNARLLIDETGTVIKVEILDKHKLPDDVRTVIAVTLKNWQYKPAQKNNMNVKAWWPVKMKIHFKYDM